MQNWYTETSWSMRTNSAIDSNSSWPSGSLRQRKVLAKQTLAGCLLLLSLGVVAQSTVPVGTILPTSQVPAHDPVMIKEGPTFYLFCTGMGISVWSSNDLRNWKKESPVFARPPQWAVDTIAGFRGHIWAPDISFHNGQYYLYYSVSAFGKNTSAIGVATNKTLNPASPDFKWTDQGRVIQSYPGKTPWNAIDPNLIVTSGNQPFLVFGSFWDGIKLVKLKADLLQPDEPLDGVTTIASRRKTDTGKGANPIEAPFIIQRGDYYYLFASIDYCCQGSNSTYKIIVGRSTSVNGPYLDKEGVELLRGGGTVFLQGNKDWYGVGHNGFCAANGENYLVYHGYDAADNGRSKLLIQKLRWEADNWPLIDAN